MTTTTDEMPESVLAWRAFGVDGFELVPPIMSDLGASRPWTPGLNRAECVGDPPCLPGRCGEDCTCGLRGVEDLEELRSLLGSDKGTVLARGGVIARVRLSGVVRPGINIPDDDPPTTWRATESEILELHLAPEHESMAGRLKAHYDVPAVVYEIEEWPHEVRPVDPLGPQREVSVDGFVEALSRLTYGEAKDLARIVAFDSDLARSFIADFVKTGQDAAKTLAGGVSAPDIASALENGAMFPSAAEAEAFVEAVITHLYPFDPRTVQRQRRFTTATPTIGQSVDRMVRQALGSVRAVL